MSETHQALVIPKGAASWLFAWVGQTDLDAASTRYGEDLGPLVQALMAGAPYDRVVLLCNYPPAKLRGFLSALARKTGLAPSQIELKQHDLASPIDYGAIYQAVSQTLTQSGLPSEAIDATFHLSPGTPAMAAIWLILARTRFPARLIQASRQRGIEEVSFTFDLASDFLPEFLRRADSRAARLLQPDRPASPHFSKIIRRCDAMAQAVDTAQRYALHDVPVLILGETGTGKELFAEAMAAASQRAGRAFVAVNCGTLTTDMVNAELFGHKRGAFTGATTDRRGYLSEADGGTLFLDEVGELPLDAQVRLLRTLQSGEVMPVGASKPHRVNVRVIAATHRDLQADVVAGRFREDLFHRLAVGIVHLPPLRERGADLDALTDHFLAVINQDSQRFPEWQFKRLTPQARALLHRHTWPGNIRELYNTLVRSCIWSRTEWVEEADLENGLLRPTLPAPSRSAASLQASSPSAPLPPAVQPPARPGLSLRDEMDALARQRILSALDATAGHRGHAAAQLGLGSHQTLSNWMKRLGLTETPGTVLA